MWLYFSVHVLLAVAVVALPYIYNPEIHLMGSKNGIPILDGFKYFSPWLALAIVGRGALYSIVEAVRQRRRRDRWK